MAKAKSKSKDTNKEVDDSPSPDAQSSASKHLGPSPPNTKRRTDTNSAMCLLSSLAASKRSKVSTISKSKSLPALQKLEVDYKSFVDDVDPQEVVFGGALRSWGAKLVKRAKQLNDRYDQRLDTSKADEESIATQAWASAVQARQHLVAFFTFGEALFPEGENAFVGGSFSAAAALDAPRRLRGFGFQCGDQWECIIAGVNAQRFLEGKQFDEAARICATRGPGDDISFLKLVVDKGCFETVALRHEDMRHKLFVGWVNEYFGQIVKVDPSECLQDGVAFKAAWERHVGPTSSRPKFEQNVFYLTAFSIANVAQDIVDCWMTALDALATDKKMPLSKSMMAPITKDKGIDMQPVGAVLRSRVLAAAAAFNADKGYQMDLMNIKMGLQFLTVGTNKQVATAILKGSDFRARWAKSLESFRAIMRSSSAQFQDKNAEEIELCRDRFMNLSSAAFDGILAAGLHELHMDKIGTTFKDFATKVHEGGIEKRLVDLLNAATKQFVPKGIARFVLLEIEEKFKRYESWLSRLLARLSSALRSIHHLFMSDNAAMSESIMCLMEELWPPADIQVALVSPIINIRKIIHDRLLEVMRKRCDKHIDIGMKKDFLNAAVNNDVFASMLPGSATLDDLAKDEAVPDLATFCCKTGDKNITTSPEVSLHCSAPLLISHVAYMYSIPPDGDDNLMAFQLALTAANEDAHMLEVTSEWAAQLHHHLSIFALRVKHSLTSASSDFSKSMTSCSALVSKLDLAFITDDKITMTKDSIATLLNSEAVRALHESIPELRRSCHSVERLVVWVTGTAMPMLEASTIGCISELKEILAVSIATHNAQE